MVYIELVDAISLSYPSGKQRVGLSKSEKHSILQMSAIPLPS
jgi:hypothetical protein